MRARTNSASLWALSKEDRVGIACSTTALGMLDEKLCAALSMARASSSGAGQASGVCTTLVELKTKKRSHGSFAIPPPIPPLPRSIITCLHQKHTTEELSRASRPR
jgi:hypothetical protein